MKLVVEVTDCRDCPFKEETGGQGFSFTICNHKDNKRGVYEDILWGARENFSAVPAWCPLGLSN